MAAEAAIRTDTGEPLREASLLELVLSLTSAAHAITKQHYRLPSERERIALGDAVARLLRQVKLHGLDGAPAMGPGEAAKTLRAALRNAQASGVSRVEIVAIFNNEEAAPDGARKDLQ